VTEDATPNTVSGNVLTNDSDADGDTLSVSNAGTVTLTYGSLVLHADGSYTYTLDNTNPVVNALNNGQQLSDTFTYSISDGHGGTAQATLQVTINGSTDGSLVLTFSN
jgi:VCBS repeat-containing protein